MEDIPQRLLLLVVLESKYFFAMKMPNALNKFRLSLAGLPSEISDVIPFLIYRI